MSDFGMTSAGFKPKRLADILTDLNTTLATVSDPNTGESLDYQDPIIQQITNIFSEGLAECWNAAYLASTQFDPLSATGKLLSGLVQLNGIQRSSGSNTIISMSLTGAVGNTVPAGSQIATLDGSLVFATNDAVYFDITTKTVNATCTVPGSNTPNNGDIINILTPVSGWNSAVNTGIVTSGTDSESDDVLRARQQISTGNTSYRMIDAIAESLSAISGVIYRRVYQNITLAPDSRGIPAKSICAVVLGGDDQAIADLIFKKSACSLGYYGSTTKQCLDTDGNSYNVSFQRPTEVPIKIVVDIVVTDSTKWPSDGPDQIKAAIVAYAQISASNSDGFPPGSSVINSRLYTPVNTVKGFKTTDIKLATGANTPIVQDITIAYNEVATFTTANITVNVS